MRLAIFTFTVISIVLFNEVHANQGHGGAAINRANRYVGRVEIAKRNISNRVIGRFGRGYRPNSKADQLAGEGAIDQSGPPRFSGLSAKRHHLRAWAGPPRVKVGQSGQSERPGGGSIGQNVKGGQYGQPGVGGYRRPGGDQSGQYDLPGVGSIGPDVEENKYGQPSIPGGARGTKGNQRGQSGLSGSDNGGLRDKEIQYRKPSVPDGNQSGQPGFPEAGNGNPVVKEVQHVQSGGEAAQGHHIQGDVRPNQNLN